MKKSNMLFAVPVAMCCAVNAHGEQSQDTTSSKPSAYIALRGGYAASSWDDAGVDPSGIAVAVAAGIEYKMTSVNLRAEVEGGLSFLGDDRDIDLFPMSFGYVENSQTFTSVLANGYVDFLADYKIKPFVGFGLGMMRLDEDVDAFMTSYAGGHTSDVSLSAAETAFAYGLHGGIGFNISQHMSADVGMRYFMTTSENSVDLFGVNVGLRYTF